MSHHISGGKRCQWQFVQFEVRIEFSFRHAVSSNELFNCEVLVAVVFIPLKDSKYIGLDCTKYARSCQNTVRSWQDDLCNFVTIL